MNRLRLGYNTNGLAHHDPLEAAELLRDIGYRSIALTLDHGCLNPFSPDWRTEVERMRRHLDQLEMHSVIETGARYLLDPRVKHEPTMLSDSPEGRRRRIEFLLRAIDTARELGSDCVSLWSSSLKEAIPREQAFARLLEGLKPVLDYARHHQVTLAFEPEPGMFIDTMHSFAELRDRLNCPDLQLTLDVGHLHCLRELPIEDYIRNWANWLRNVHIEDMRAGVHEHLMFGEGEMEFGPILQALRDIGYAGGVHVELSRHSHSAPETAKKAFDFLMSVR